MPAFFHTTSAYDATQKTDQTVGCTGANLQVWISQLLPVWHTRSCAPEVLQ